MEDTTLSPWFLFVCFVFKPKIESCKLYSFTLPPRVGYRLVHRTYLSLFFNFNFTAILI